MFALNALSLLAFLPGVVLIHILVKKKLKVTLSTMELFIAGSLIWNFVLIVPSLLLGFLGSYILYYFLIFIFMSIGIILLWSFLIVFHKLDFSVPPFVFSTNLLYVLHTLFLFFFLFIITVYHPLFVEWDAVSIYLPVAKSIAVDGSLYSRYHLSDIIVYISPGLEIIYAWTFFFTGDDYFRLLPFVYFLLNSFCVYLLSEKISGKLGALVALISFLSIPSTVRILAVNSLYSDIAFTFFVSASILFVIKAVEEDNAFSYLLTGMACTLAALTKQFGFVTSLLVVSLILLFSRMKFRRAISLLCLSGVFNFFFLWDVLDPFLRSLPNYLEHVLLRQLPILFWIFFLFLLSCSIKGNNTKLKNMFTFFAPFMIILILVIHNIMKFGIVTGSWGPGISKANNLSLTSIPPISETAIGTYFEWHPLFLSIGLGVTYVVPLIIGICSIVYNSLKGRRVCFTLCAWIATFIMIWAFFGRCIYNGPCFRYLYYFAPMFSIIIGEGTSLFAKLLKLDKKYALYSFIMFNAIIFVYVWTYYFNIDIISALFALEFGIPSILNIYFFSSLFTTIFLLAHLFSNIRKELRFLVKRSRSVRVMLLIFIVLSQAIPSSNIILPVFYYVNDSGWDTSYFNKLLPHEPAPLGVGWASIYEVIDYYNKFIKDNYITVSYFAYYLMYYGDRSVIDLGYLYGYQSLLPLLECNDTTALMGKLLNSNIRYFLIPKSSYPVRSIYDAYKVDSERFLLFKEIRNNPHFVLLKEFTYYQLYKLLTLEEYQQYLKQPYHYFNYEKEPLIISDDNQERLYLSTTSSILLADESNFKIKGENALKIEIHPYLSQKHEYITYAFESPITLTNKDFISFYWYGNNSGILISIRFETGSWKNQFEFLFTDSWNGWARLIIPLDYFRVHVGSPSWDNITAISFNFFEKVDTYTVFYVDHISADVGIADFYLIKYVE